MTYSTLSELCDALGRYAVASLEAKTPETKSAIRESILAEWIGDDPNASKFSEPSETGEFVWRALYLQDTIISLREMSDWVSAVPFRKPNIPVSRQLEFMWWTYFLRIGEFQERAYKFFNSARHFAFDSNAKAQLSLSRSKFCLRHLKSLEKLIEIRNSWVHDQAPEFKQLKRISNLELYHLAYGLQAGSPLLPNMLKNLAKEAGKSEKKRLLDMIESNDEKFVILADRVVQSVCSHTVLPRFN